MPDAGSQTESQPKMIFVIEHDESRKRILTAMLEQGGYKVQSAPDFLPAVDTLLVLSGFAAIVCNTESAAETMPELLKYAEKKKIPLVLIGKAVSGASSGPSPDAKSVTIIFEKLPRVEELLQALEVCTADHTVPDQKALASEGFCRVAIDDFMSGKILRFDVFIRLGAEKYLKVANRGDELSRERLDSYQAKGARFLYLRADDFMTYLGFNVLLSKEVAAKTVIPLNKRMKLVAHTEEIILDQLFVEKITMESVDAAQAIVESSVAMLSATEASYGLLGMLRAHDEQLFAHCIGVSFYSVLVARQLGLTDPEEIYKVAIGGLLHDIGKKELDKALLLKPDTQLTSKECKTIESHTHRAMDILGPFQNLSDEIIRMTVEHHETPLGVGYPRGLRDIDIHPFAKIVSLADEFCYLALPTPNGPGVEPDVALSMMWKSHRRYPDPKYFVALLKAFKMKIDDKVGIVKPL